MEIKVKHLTALTLCVFLMPAFAQQDSTAQIKTLSHQYQVEHSVLEDFVQSYNFKCPAEITRPQLTDLLDRLDDDTELSVMMESNRLQWRDTYVEARSTIACLTQGEIFKGY